MKKTKKIISIIIVIMMLTVAIPFVASAEQEEQAEQADTITVSLRIEGATSIIFYEKEVVLPAGSTVESLMRQVNEDYDDLGVVFSNYDWGDAYISEIAGLAEGAYGGFSGWIFHSNGAEIPMGIGLVDVYDGDDIVFFYSDAYGEAGMQYPYPDISQIYTCSKIGFTSEDSTWDEDWNEIITLNPVVGATVTFNGSTYVTDENGEITLDDIAGIAGMMGLQIERYDEDSGIPTVLRLAPDYEMYIPFSDTPDDEWYEIAVMYSVREGYFIGIDSEQNLFAPTSITTKAQLITICGRVAGEEFNTSLDPWYGEPYEWAVENGIIDAGEFDPNEAVTREMFISMFYLTAMKIGTYDMTLRADITGAVDYEQCNEEYLETISWAVATGIIRGTSVDALAIEPTAEINRAQVCQMLLNYFSN